MSGIRPLSLWAFFLNNCRSNPLMAAKAAPAVAADAAFATVEEEGGSVERNVTLAVSCSLDGDRHSGSAASRQQKWSNSGSWWHGFSAQKKEKTHSTGTNQKMTQVPLLWLFLIPRFSRTRSCDLMESCTSARLNVAVATKSNFGPLQTRKKNLK